MPPEPSPRDEAPTPEQLDALFAKVDSAIEREAGFLGTMRRAPLGARVGASASVALLLAGAAWGLMPRADWAARSVPGEHLAAMLMAAALVFLGALLAAWPLQRRAPSTAQIVVVGLATAALALGMGVALGAPEATAGGEAVPALRCAMLGLVLGAPAAMLAFALRRDASGAAVGAVAVGSGVALLAQTTTCAIETLPHMALGHAAPLLIAGGLATAWALGPAIGARRTST